MASMQRVFVAFGAKDGVVVTLPPSSTVASLMGASPCSNAPLHCRARCAWRAGCGRADAIPALC